MKDDMKLPPYDNVNLECRIVSLEIMVKLIIEYLSSTDRSALARYADTELDRIKKDLSFDRYPDIAQTLKDSYLSDILPERNPNMED